MVLDLFRGFTGEMSSELESALENPETDVLFNSFLLERKERPGLLDLIKTEQTFKDYLSMPVECRAEVESLRLKDPEFLAGDFKKEPAVRLQKKPSKLSERAFEFWKKLYAENAVQKITEKFIEHSPSSRFGPTSLMAWFKSYDINSGKNLDIRVDKVRHPETGQANKIYQNYSRSGDKLDSDFEEWVIRQLPPALQYRLKQTPYFLHKRHSVDEIVKAFIKHNSISRQGPVTLSNWFNTYDINTGENLIHSKEGNKTRHGKPLGNKFYAEYRRLNAKNKDISFEDWIMQQLSAELQEQLKQTVYFQQGKYTIIDIVQAYIKHQPATNRGPVPLTSWFTSYDSKTGEYLFQKVNGSWKAIKPVKGSKHYALYLKSDFKAKDIGFEEWVFSQIPVELQEQLRQTAYFQQKKFSVDDIVRAYIKHAPVNRTGHTSLSAWFRNYDPTNGVYIKKQLAGQLINPGTAFGNKFVQKYKPISRSQNITFDEWILSQLQDDDLKAQLQSTPYWRSKYDS